ncbi:MAG: response regulator [Acidobacteriaceae bacterium]|nr:response regulator [Acidobacteriaceae bacterium]
MRSYLSPRAQSSAAILLVDDNQDGSNARRYVLEEFGFKVVSTRCGHDALKAIEEQNFDLIVTDYKMSPMDGLELIRKLRGRNFKNPIILLTGFADALGMRPDTTGADVVVQKSANEVSTLVRHAKRLTSVPKKPARSVGAGGGAQSQSGG